MTLLCSWVALLAPLISAYFCCKSVLRNRNRELFFLCVAVLWMTLSTVPVQFVGAFEITGLITRVTVVEIAWLQLAILVGCTALYFAHGTPAYHLNTYSLHQSSDGTRERLPLFLKLSVALIGASYLLFAIDLYTSLPKGSDALAYHIPLALKWLQEGSLRFPVSKAWQFSGPGNDEIIQMLALATGRQALIPLPNLLASAVLAVAAYPLALRFTAKQKGPALAATLILFTIPIIEFQTFSGYVDVFGVALLFSAVTLFGHRYRSDVLEIGEVKITQTQNLSFSAVVFAALACGLSLGTKLTFIPYCGLFFVIAIYVLWRERRIHNRPLILLVSLVTGGMLLPSAFWYARNLQATGNPVYPVQVSLGNRAIFPGFESVVPDADNLLIDEKPGGPPDQGDRKYVRRRLEWLIYPWTEWLRNAGSFPIVYGEASGFGGAFATFVTVGLAFAVYRCMRLSSFSESSGITWRVLLLWFLMFVVWVFAMHRTLRFGLPVWILACLLSAPAIGLMMKAYPRGSAILFVCAIASTCAVSSLVPFHDLASHMVARKWSRSAVYAYPAFIDELPAGACVLNDSLLSEKNFALAGKRLTNRVVAPFETPRKLTPDFISSRNIDYVVMIRSVTADDLSPAVLPASVPGTEVFHAIQAGKIWRIWKVKP